jgi:anti-sigma factor RsiW
MCPEKQFLSVYFDGELPSPWKERMEQHIEICSECRGTLTSYKKTSEFLNSAEGCAEVEYDAAMNTAQARVWEKISSRAAGQRTRRTATLFFPRIPSNAFAAIAGAAAAAVIISVTTLVAPDGVSSDAAPALSATAVSSENFENIAVSSDYDIDIPDITPVADMDAILRYLETDDSSNIVIIKLPERKKFRRNGEPTFINAADYSKRSGN